MDKNKEKNEALKWAEKNLLGKLIFNKSINANVAFDKAGIKHAICARMSPRKIAFIYDVSNLLGSAVLFDIQEDKIKRPDIKKVYKLVSYWNYQGDKIIVHIIVRLKIDGHIYYDHEAFKEKNLG